MWFKDQPRSIKRNLRQVKHWRAHVDGDTPVRREAWLDDALHGLHADRVFVGLTPLMHEAGKAACAIATLLHLGTVGVVDHVFEIDAMPRRGAHSQYLVSAHTKVAVAQKAIVGRSEA